MDEDADFTYLTEHDVRFAETDAQGVVFFGEYLTYLDEAVLNYWKAIGHPYEGVLEDGWEVFVVHAELDYHTSATYGDTLRGAVRVAAVGTSSITFEYRCERADGTLLATGELVQVAVDELGESAPIPEFIREAIAAFQH